MPTLDLYLEQVEQVREYRTLADPFGAGSILRRSAYPGAYPARRQWRLVWQTMTMDELSTLRLLWAQTQGGATSMDWTPPGEAATVVRFLDESLEWEAVNAGYVRASVTVEEVR